PASIELILASVKSHGYSAQNVAFGMGGGLLQKVNRDSMSFATKLSHIESPQGISRNVMKMPKTDSGKFSLPGIFRVVLQPCPDGSSYPKVYPDHHQSPASNQDLSSPSATELGNMLRIVYDNGPVPDLVWDDFDTIKQRVEHQWNSRPLKADVLSDELKSLFL
ncbi:Nicotinamide phosphoribosyltransferase, partial [Smittium mucronatum]